VISRNNGTKVTRKVNGRSGKIREVRSAGIATSHI
jgi:hypothetical protein